MCGGLPFLIAVGPSERTKMSAAYSTYRDVFGVITLGTAKLAINRRSLADDVQLNCSWLIRMCLSGDKIEFLFGK